MKQRTDDIPKTCELTSTPKILIVEDSKFFAKMLCRVIEDSLGFEVEWHDTYAEAVEAIDCCKQGYMVALFDLNLPDAPNGEIVQYATKKGVPCIIFTGSLDDKLRSRFLKWNVVDYILKDSGQRIDTLLDILRRIHKNCSVKVLVADDSKSMREAVCKLLRTQLFNVIEAESGPEALQTLDENPDIKLIVTDYEMPGMTGVELIGAVRENHPKDELAIIGMSAAGDPLLSARLIKAGANDFVHKPFQVEEFHVRVGHAIEMLEKIELIRDLSYKDPLTRLHNRRYFFENADKFMAGAKKKGQKLAVAMLDIDFFKKVNDTYGHDGGDVVLVRVASLIREGFPDNAITCRFGGEEFCVLLAYDGDDVVAWFDGFRRAIERERIDADGETIAVTVSIGVCSEPDTIESMLKLADSRLYTAKETGRNRVVGKPPKANVRD